MAWSKNMDWSKFYQLPQPFPELYLKRLGVSRQPVSRAFLDELIQAHLLTIPFENLDVTDLGLPVSIEPEQLMEKLLLRSRGGFCFELNGAFSLLLSSLGFDAWICPCRQLRHSEPCPVPATHCGILIYLDGKVLFCDVGYGGPVPRGSLEFRVNFTQYVGEDAFSLQTSSLIPRPPRYESNNAGWYTLIRRSANHEELPLMQILPAACYLCDFYGQSALRSSGDTAYEVRHVSKMLTDGFVDLTGNQLTVATNNSVQKRDIADWELKPVLKEWFQIVL